MSYVSKDNYIYCKGKAVLTQAISLMQLHRDNDSKTNARAKNCKTFNIHYKRKNPDRYIFLVRCQESYSDSSGHLVSLLFSKENGIYPLEADAKIKCSCPAWVYWGSEYQATAQGYWLDEQEFRYPFIRDPRQEHKICKHVARVRLDLRNKTFNTLNRKRTLIRAAELLPLCSIEDCSEAIRGFFNRNNIPDSDSFIKGLDENTFESELLRIGMIQ